MGGFSVADVKDGLIVAVKKDCATCVMVDPVIGQLAEGPAKLMVFSQDDPEFPVSVTDVIDDRELERSYRLNIDTVPTLIKVQGGREVARAVGWNRAAWESLSGEKGLGADLPAHRPGCGAINAGPGMPERLAVKFGDAKFSSRVLTVPDYEDEIEACFDREWTDGLPVVPPTRERVYRMLQGTSRGPEEIVGVVPPDLVECTVEKVAINAVMAGCKPEYLPVVLAAVEAACMDEFCMHGLLATTWFSGPMVIVNGPIRRAIGMNWAGNCLGQGNRANATIGRALQLIVRNVGGGKPQGIDRATFGNPGKYTFCFAEDEDGSPWEPLSVERGVAPGKSAVTLFAADGVQGVFDQISRTPESLVRTFAACLRTTAHPKIALASDAFVVVSPEHGRVFREAGWSKAKVKEEIGKLLMLPGAEMIRGAGGIAEGLPEHLKDVTIPKFRPGGLNIVHAGGAAGLFSAIISGCLATGAMGSSPVTKEISQ